MTINRCDLALALAPFRRRWGTAAVIVALFAIACALTVVNSSVFFFLHTRPLPYPNYDRAVWIGQSDKFQRQPAGEAQTLDNSLFLQTELKSVERIGAFNSWRNETLRHGEISETVTGCWITPGFFEILGLKPALGATFSDPLVLGRSPRPLLLSARLWERRFASNPSVLHQTVWLNDRPHVIVGVFGPEMLMPGHSRDEQPEFWAPLDPQDIPKPEWKSRWFPTLALLRPGVPVAQLQAELDLATNHLRQLYPNLMTGRQLVAHDLKSWLLGPHHRYFTLLIATAALLSVLIAINIVNLLLGKLADLTAYFQVSRALGATPRQTLRPLLLEHVLLCIAGTFLAVPATLGYRHLLVTTLERTGLLLPTFDGALFVLVALGGTALVVGTLIFGVRALHSERRSIEASVNPTRVVVSRSRGWLDGLSILGQTALAITLLVACSLLALSLRRQASANDHLPIDELQRAFLIVRPEKYSSQTVAMRRLLEVKAAILALPEIKSAGLAQPALPDEQSPIYAMIDDLDTLPINESPKRVIRASACPDYFATMGLRIVAGRGFTEQDLQAERRLMVISQRVAELYWPGRDPIGRRLRVNHRTDDWAEIIGVAEDLESPLTNQRLPMVWRSFNHHPFVVVTLLFQTRTSARLPLDWFQSAVRSVDPDVMIGDYDGVTEFLRNERWLPESTARLSFLLASVASAVCGFGIFSILNRRVAASLKEIAVRKALGAPAWKIVSNVGRRDFGWILAGLAIGGVFSLLGMRQVFEIANLRLAEMILAPLAGIAGVLAGAALGALIPLVRALAADTLPLLRNEA